MPKQEQDQITIGGWIITVTTSKDGSLALQVEKSGQIVYVDVQQTGTKAFIRCETD